MQLGACYVTLIAPSLRFFICTGVMIAPTSRRYYKSQRKECMFLNTCYLILEKYYFPSITSYILRIISEYGKMITI